ncbi:hypothetical protein SAMN06309944_0256 [Micrococcales bacterium KH10]|nr:hypothetical protein SAMN06309944_0256 [Micrococcales bacterium KH10]
MVDATYMIGGTAGSVEGRWKLKRGTTWRSSISTRATDIQIPGWHGSIPSQRDAIDSTRLQFVWHVYGDQDNPGELMENLDHLRSLVTTPRADLTITRQGGDFTPTGLAQTAVGRLRNVEEPNVIVPGALAELRATVELMSPFWRSSSEVEWNYYPESVGNISVTMSAFDVITAPITDAIILIDGPADGLRIANRDGYTHQPAESVLIDMTLNPNEQLRLDCATWEAQMGVGIEWSDLGADVSAAIKPSVDVGPALTFTPQQGDPPAIFVNQNGTQISRIGVRAKGAYL